MRLSHDTSCSGRRVRSTACRDKPEFVETDTTDRPVSLYAATKKSGEVMAHSYAHLFDIPTTVCRFFTVYGPNGRPDMSLFKFVRAILNDEPIDVFGKGVHERDFTYRRRPCGGGDAAYRLRS